MTRIASRLAIGLIAAGLVVGSASAQGTGSLPDYLADITGTTPQTPAALATRDVLQLNVSMFELYENAAPDLPEEHPGQPPGDPRALLRRRRAHDPLSAGPDRRWNAPSVPVVYQVMKSTRPQHDGDFRGRHAVYRPGPTTRPGSRRCRPTCREMKTARAGIDTVPMPDDWRPISARHARQQHRLHGAIACQRGVIKLDALQAFAKKQGPNLKLIVNWAASTQVKHWMGVLDGWRASLGPDWDKAYAASQHHLRGAAEQRAVQHARAVFRPPKRSTTG